MLSGTRTDCEMTLTLDVTLRSVTLNTYALLQLNIKSSLLEPHNLTQSLTLTSCCYAFVPKKPKVKVIGSNMSMSTLPSKCAGMGQHLRCEILVARKIGQSIERDSQA